ncbi:hypothetical protein HQR03_05855 [Psychrobacter okhotskensis]|uniref:beta strand repeat-containing protein n=1 Tax=Psychrobacter okhotskensis TaxID=212403 RepID=UPI001564BE6D|nr:DUF11 domain-containing protein [Psychrobacter okhotskensis]NRD70061.1 hypothetical protein [Psychrobacter okhotskensis]
MKSNLFKYSVLTVGVVAAMGVAHAAQQPTGGTSNGSFSVANQASASYTIAGNENAPQLATSNIVTISVSEQSSFTLLTDNVNQTINPKANSTVNFTHTLTNSGNVDDTYTLRLTNATSGDDFDYSGYSVTYLLNNTGTAITVPITNGVGTISLPAKSAANITIVATANTARNIDKNGILTVSAESTYLKGKNAGTPSAYTASNVDNAKTVAPLYAITKSATTNLGTKNLDLNNLNAFVDYTITIKNEGNLDGKAISISDDLPSGLVAIASTEANYTAPTVTASNGSTAGTAKLSAANKTITVDSQNIKVGETITVTFRAKKAANATSASSFVNYAVVKDDTANDNNATTPDITDRSDDGTETTYENKVTGAYLGKDDNTKATVTTTNQTRAIAITTGANKEVALNTSGAAVGNTYSYTITNNGTDVTEAATAGSVLFSVNPTATGTAGVTNNPNIEIARVFVDANGDGIFTAGETVLTGTQIGTTGEYTYDLNAAKTTGFAPGAANAIKIGVEVVTTGSNSNAGGVGTSDIGKYETMTLTIVPKTEVNGTAIPTSTTENPLSTTSKTTMQGINLVKYQIAADCTTAIPANNATDWSTATATATAGQCIFYKIEAVNTFTTTEISTVAITDTISTKAVYQTNFVASPTTGTNGTSTNATTGVTTVRGNFATLASGATATVRFSVKPSQSGTN